MTLSLLINLEKMVGSFWPLVLEFGSLWTRFGPLAKSRSGNPGSVLSSIRAGN